ncbi:LysR substrate-binding domain-containing protein [Azospirillum doebereinerae]|uniref:LysR family transcriptional regulator n=1 Tax=Azospirillum doebereinerae TaxID=92933 RepID=A0A3S0X790_9PROT|nr:LysR substrate-binding domain-containing protein [Azospirillum doebereinerae]RUQ63075.1 LysR family transcriptional regulator [Azospirillum doebereinerae]
MATRHLDQRLRLSLLRAVEAIDANRSLMGASAAVGISQPSLTKSLHVAEEILQVQLFERHSRGVTPSEAGTAVAGTARRILAELRQLDVELTRLMTSESCVLSLGVLPVAAAGVLPGVISRLARQHPRIKVRLEQGLTDDLLPLLATGEIELVVGRLYEPDAEDRFVREPLWSEPFSFLARSNHPLLRGGRIDLEQLRGCDLLIPSVAQRLGRETEQWLSLLGLDAAVALRSGSFEFIREMLHESDSLSVVPRLLMVGDLLRGTLQTVPLQFTSPSRPAGIITIAGRNLGPSAQAFIHCLRTYIAEIGSRGV